MIDDNQQIEIGQRLAAHFTTLTGDDLRAASGLGLRQPHQYEVQRDTMHRWRHFATRGYNKNQMVAYANVPLLAFAEITRRAGTTPTVSSVVANVIAAGFTPKTAAWSPGELRRQLLGYLASAEKRGLCRLR